MVSEARRIEGNGKEVDSAISFYAAVRPILIIGGLVIPQAHYSSRNATSGLMWVARRVGTKVAKTATIKTAANTIG